MMTYYDTIIVSYYHISFNPSKYKALNDNSYHNRMHLDITCIEISSITTSSFMHEIPLTSHSGIEGDNGAVRLSAAESEPLDQEQWLICQIVGN